MKGKKIDLSNKRKQQKIIKKISKKYQKKNVKKRQNHKIIIFFSHRKTKVSLIIAETSHHTERVCD